MATVMLSASPKGNGYQATIAFSDGVSISSAEAFPRISGAVAAAATKLLEMPERLADLDSQSSEIEADS
jgi:hypothetical protein